MAERPHGKLLQENINYHKINNDQMVTSLLTDAATYSYKTNNITVERKLWIEMLIERASVTA